MRPFVIGLMIAPCFAPSAFGVGQKPPPLSFGEADRTGEIIGAARACGISEERIASVARKAKQRIHAMASSDAERQDALVRHDFVANRFLELFKAGEGNCGDAVAKFQGLEAER